MLRYLRKIWRGNRKVKFSFVELILLMYSFIQKYRKHNLRLKICFSLTIWKIDNVWKNYNIETATLKDWKHWIKFNVKIFSYIDIALSFYVHFSDVESKSMSMPMQILRLDKAGLQCVIDSVDYRRLLHKFQLLFLW